MGPIRYGGYRPPRESFVRLKVGGEDEDGDGGAAGDGDDSGFEIFIHYINRLSPKYHKLRPIRARIDKKSDG